MTKRHLSFEAWMRRPAYAKDQLKHDEKRRLDALRKEITPVHALDWWNDFKIVDNIPKGNYFGVRFGFECESCETNDISRRIGKTVRVLGFEFKVVDIEDRD